MFRHVLILVISFSFIAAKVRGQQVIDTVCTGNSDVPYSVDLHAGSVYSWSVEGGEIASGNGTNRITVNWKKQPGIFRLSVVEQNETKCWGDSVFASVLVQGSNFNTSFPPYACLYDTVTVKASGGLWYRWENGETDSILQFRLNSDTLFKVMITDTSCGLRTDSFTINIKAVSKPAVDFSTETPEVYKNQPVYFSYTGNPGDKVTWDVQKAIRQHLSGTDINITFIDTGDAYIKLYSTNILGCKDSLSRIINIKDEQLFFPDAFTPNGDGLNDTFKPGGLGIKTYHLEVFDRWGQKLFETTDLKQGWDGTFRGNPVQSDTYIYQCDARGRSGQLYTYTGNITILR